MLDCALDISEVTHFIPIPTIPGSKLMKITECLSITDDRQKQHEKISEELKDCMGRTFVDGALEFSIPEFGLVDISQIDAVLISNFSTLSALPYLTKNHDFRGKIYATEPTKQIGKLLMEEMVHYVERNPKLKVATYWKQERFLSLLPASLKDIKEPRTWRQLFNQHEIDACLAKILTVGFGEKLDFYGSLKVRAESSGRAIGSCNWIIQSNFEKVCYVSGSSTLTTHPKPMDQTPLKNSDVLILCGLIQTPLRSPDSMIGEFCSHCVLTLKHGGNVLVPCYPSGTIYDLFEILSVHLDQCGLSSASMYFVSPVANHSLAYSNIYAEWLSKNKQSRLYLPEYPFPHADISGLVPDGELWQTEALQGYQWYSVGAQVILQTPFNNKKWVVDFVYHALCSLAIHHCVWVMLFTLWKRGVTILPTVSFSLVIFRAHTCGLIHLNFLAFRMTPWKFTVIKEEPDFPYLDALAPYQPILMKAFYFPIDTSLSFSQANILINENKPAHLVVAETYTRPPLQAPQRSDLTIEWDLSLFTYRKYEVINLPIKRTWETIHLDQNLAASLEPVEVTPGTSVCMVTASLTARDNKYILKELPEEEQTKMGIKRRPDGSVVRKTYAFGSPNISKFVALLTEQGISSIKVEESEGGSIIHLPNDDSLIQVDSTSTHIICDDENIRVRLKDTVLKCLKLL